MIDSAAEAVTESPTVLCFHHAGGSASVYRRWSDSAILDVVPVQLPGRENRRREQRFTDLSALLDLLEIELADVMNKPYVLFGHSMGALVAYRLAVRALEAGRRLPESLVVAAGAPPHVPTLPLPLDSLTDLEIAHALAEFDGLPAVLLDRPEWLGPLLAVVKDDIRVCQSNRVDDTTTLPIPIHAIGGTTDRLVSTASLAQWDRHTSREFSMTTIDGGHFLTTDNSEELFSLVERIVRTTVGSVSIP
ncbi:MAG: thioesterase II family protein [Rhodococcus sp. (in: high G+C Gram-positive bacteria)]